MKRQQANKNIFFVLDKRVPKYRAIYGTKDFTAAWGVVSVTSLFTVGNMLSNAIRVSLDFAGILVIKLANLLILRVDYFL